MPTVCTRIDRLTVQSLTASSRRAQLWGVLAFVVGTVVILAVTWGIGPYTITQYSNDTALLLAQGDCLQRGMRPYVDYFSTYGFFPFLFLEAGIRLHGISLQALMTAQALAAVVLGTIGMWVGFRRINPLWASVTALAFEASLLSFTPIGSASWREFSGAMWYNVVGYVLEGILFLYLFFPAKEGAISAVFDSVLAGACLAALFLTKLTFFMPTALVLALGLIVWPHGRRQRWQGVVLFASAVGVLMLLMIWKGASFPGYLGFVRSVPLSVSPFMLVFRYLHFSRIIATLMVMFFLAWYLAVDQGLFREMRREFVLAILMTGAILYSVSTACQDQEQVPLVGIGGLALAVMIGQKTISRSDTLPRGLLPCLVLISALTLLQTPKNAVLSWVFSRANVSSFTSASTQPTDRALDAGAAGFSTRVDPALISDSEPWFALHVVDACSLLRSEQAAPGEVLFVASGDDFITMLTDLRHAAGSVPHRPFFFVTSPKAFPVVNSDLLNDTKWVLRDLRGEDCWEFLMHHRQAYFSEHFAEVGRNASWVLYKRQAE